MGERRKSERVRGGECETLFSFFRRRQEVKERERVTEGDGRIKLINKCSLTHLSRHV